MLLVSVRPAKRQAHGSAPLARLHVGHHGATPAAATKDGNLPDFLSLNTEQLLYFFINKYRCLSLFSLSLLRRHGSCFLSPFSTGS